MLQGLTVMMSWHAAKHYTSSLYESLDHKSPGKELRVSPVTPGLSLCMYLVSTGVSGHTWTL